MGPAAWYAMGVAPTIPDPSRIHRFPSGPAFEAWIGRPFAHGDRHFELACQLPVTRA